MWKVLFKVYGFFKVQDRCFSSKIQPLFSTILMRILYIGYTADKLFLYLSLRNFLPWCFFLVIKLTDICSTPTGVSWGPDRRLDVFVTMVTSGWGAWAISPCGLVLVICSSVCLSQQPDVKPADCSRKEHPVVSHQGECVGAGLLFNHSYKDFFRNHSWIHSSCSHLSSSIEREAILLMFNSRWCQIYLSLSRNQGDLFVLIQCTLLLPESYTLLGTWSDCWVQQLNRDVVVETGLCEDWKHNHLWFLVDLAARVPLCLFYPSALARSRLKVNKG